MFHTKSVCLQNSVFPRLELRAELLPPADKEWKLYLSQDLRVSRAVGEQRKLPVPHLHQLSRLVSIQTIKYMHFFFE